MLLPVVVAAAAAPLLGRRVQVHRQCGVCPKDGDDEQEAGEAGERHAAAELADAADDRVAYAGEVKRRRSARRAAADAGGLRAIGGGRAEAEGW